LVEQMIRVAAGHPLPADWLAKGKPGIPFHGWAHEARVYAEDPTRNFLPSIGRLTTYIEPKSGPEEGVRCDTGVVQGSEISIHYDPMICKLCTYAETRQYALDKLELALDNYVIQGVRHNQAFIRDVLRSDRFKKGNITTNYIPEEYPKGFVAVKLQETEARNLAAVAAHMELSRADKVSTSNPAVIREFYEDNLVGSKSSLEDDQQRRHVVVVADETYEVAVDAELRTTVKKYGSNEEPQIVEMDSFEWPVDTPLALTQIKGKPIAIQVHERLPLGFRLQMVGAVVDVSVRTLREHQLFTHMIAKKKEDFSKWLQSPMPGTLVSVAVKAGDEVFAGQELAVVEAMKMMNPLASPKNGFVKAILVQAGKSVAVDQNLIEFTE